MKLKMDDGSVIDTDRAKQSWREDTNWNGSNYISVATGQQWRHETLYRSAKDRYYILRSSDWQGEMDSAEYISDYEAATWLIANGHELPEALAQYEEKVTE
jgi:hypothetical protein